MSEFLNKNTVSATFWCLPCRAATEHQVLGGRKAGCKVCMAKQEAEKAKREAEKVAEPEQMGLFGSN